MTSDAPRPPKGMTYADYLQLDKLLSAQQPLSEPMHHDELLFIVIHQTTELWFKLMVHELQAALVAIDDDDVGTASKILARVKHIQRQLFDQWDVLATLTPSEYTQFRNVLGQSSGFQSVQYRQFEFLLGLRDARILAHHEASPEGVATLEAALTVPSLYDAFLRYLARRGLPVPAEVLERDLSQTHTAHEGVVEVVQTVYADTTTWWDAYELAEKLVDIEENLSLWRFRHLKVVARIIGFKMGTGGSSGVPFLWSTLDKVCFPELMQVRTRL